MIGQRVGNYVITQKLGEGGMGAVYQAEHPQIGKRVALKVLHGELTTNQDIAKRFFHEAKAVNDIGHPNIVDILDFGTSGAEMYLVMELLAGRTLTSVIEQGPLEPQRALAIALQVADALAASHERGIVHRDLKPDNIMLVARGRDPDFVKLLDFGIAKIDGGGSKTRTGMVIGTPTYMSPEQCEGRGSVDHRTDIYALGIVLYEMLTGRVPFHGDGYGEILVKQMTEAPMPPSAVRPGLSPHLEQLVMKALHKRPEDRFANMREVVSALSQPQQYIEQHGGLARFAPAQAASPHAATRVIGAAPVVQTSPTTLSQSVGQLGPAYAQPPATTAITGKRAGKGLLVGAGLAVVAATAAVAFVLLQQRGTTSAQPAAEPTAVEVEAPVTKADTPPPPAPPPPAPNPEPAATTAEPKQVTLSVVTQPAGAAVYVGGEAKPRCTSPCEVEAPHGTEEATLTLKLAGFADATRTLKLDADRQVEVALAKKPAGKPARKPAAKPGSPQPIGDNTLNPFE